jgi:DNA-binding CsgD family transcriptional regulator/tetratricopeptide (TPR) repeat protein
VAGEERFVGRQEELDLLGRRLADARAGSGRVVLVSGPAGIGKTRLVEEFAAGAGDLPTGWGGAVADAGMPALWPWTRALRGLPGPRAALASLVAGDAQAAYGSADDAAATTFAADTRVVDALADEAGAGTGLLLVLDDLHWADRATLRLLERVATEVRRLPLLVIGTHRDGAGEPLHGVHRQGATEELPLGPLDPQDARTLLSTAVARADPAAVRRAAQISGGSPLYLLTLTRVAADQMRGTGSWDDAVGEAPAFRHLVTAALRSAGPDTAAAVEALSVLGPTADVDLVARLLDLDSGGTAIELLRPAVPAGLVRIPSAGTTVHFAHVLVRDAAYASLPAPRRAALHRRAAELLEPMAAGRDEWAGAVARHWVRAGEPDRAVSWAVRAAEAARAAGSYEDAASYLQLALDALDRAGAPGADRAELLLDLARVEYLSGRITPSLRTCRRVADDGERSGRADVVARAAITVQGIGHQGANVQIEDLCRRALPMLAHTAMPDLRARVEAQLACALMELEAVDEAAVLSHRALVDAQESGDPDAELDAIRARTMLLWRSAQDAELFELGGRAIELADITRRPLARLWAHVWRSDVAIRRADPAAAQAEISGMRALADRTGLPLVRWHLLRREASLAALTGSFDTFRRLGRQAAQLAESWQDQSARYTHLGQTVCLALLRGDPSDITPGWTDMVADVERLPLVARALVATALLMAGRRDEARSCYEPLVPALLAARTGLDAAAVAYLVYLAPAFEDVPACLAIGDWLAEIFGAAPAIGVGVVVYLGSVARIRGQLALAAGRPDTAIAYFEEGLTVDAALGARPFLAHGRLGLAQALAATGDATRAVELGRAAANDARRLDMPGLLRAADAFLTATAGRVRVDDPLTEREREVVALVAQALTNREVATALVLSERTVESHVRRILAKTGLTSRTELTRWYLHRQR